MKLRSANSGEMVARSITRLGDAARLFFRFGSARAMISGLTISAVVRLVAARWTGWSRWDLVAVAIVALLVPFVEWFIHLLVLHARPRTVLGLTIDPGIGHRQHHLNPATIDWVLLRSLEASVFQIINAGVVALVVGLPLLLIGVAPLGPILTGVVAAIIGLLHYEWSHFLFHVAYRPKSRYYRRLKANHRLHHWRNERYWLGITSNLGDRVLRTYPASRSAVPLSATAKTLGIEPDADQPSGA